MFRQRDGHGDDEESGSIARHSASHSTSSAGPAASALSFASFNVSSPTVRKYVRYAAIFTLCALVLMAMFNPYYVKTRTYQMYRSVFPKDYSTPAYWPPNAPRLKVVIVIPITSKGAEIDARDDVRSILFLNTFMHHFVKSIDPQGRFEYTVYYGIATNDEPLMDPNVVSEMTSILNEMTADLPITVRRVQYPWCPLSCLYNTITKFATHDGTHDYFIIFNDDVRIDSQDWTEALVQALENNPVRANFGMAGPYEYFDGIQKCPNYIMVHRSHVELFGMFFDSFFESYGIDNAMCVAYTCVDSSFYIPDIRVTNHVAGDVATKPLPRRYTPPANWQKDVQMRGEAWCKMLKESLHDQALPQQ
jgi:hypothetical protein